jgi:hypothetical protein
VKRQQPSWIEQAPDAELARECELPGSLEGGRSRVRSWGANIGRRYDNTQVDGWTPFWRYVPADGFNDARAVTSSEAAERRAAVGNAAEVRRDPHRSGTVVQGSATVPRAATVFSILSSTVRR